MKDMKIKPVTAAIAAAVTLVGTASMVNDNPFGQTDLSQGYQNAEGHAISYAGKDGEGKCGEDKKAEGKSPSAF